MENRRRNKRIEARVTEAEYEAFMLASSMIGESFAAILRTSLKNYFRQKLTAGQKKRIIERTFVNLE